MTLFDFSDVAKLAWLHLVNIEFAKFLKLPQRDFASSKEDAPKRDDQRGPLNPFQGYYRGRGTSEEGLWA